VYAINFPWMDTEGSMCKKSANGGQENDGAFAARQALATIGMMRRRLKMADGWFRTIDRVHKYFVRIKKDFRRNARALAENPSQSQQLGQLSLREGGYGGGLEEFKMIELTLKEFGSLEDQDLEMTDAPDVTESVASTGLKGDAYGVHEQSPPEGEPVRQDRWNAINNTPTGGPPTETVTTNGIHPAYNSAQMRAPSASTSPTVSKQNLTTSNHTSPLLSPVPPPYGGQQFPPYPPHQAAQTQQASMNIHKNQQPPPPAPVPSPMTAEQTDMWLRSLETGFGGEDVTAFVEGKDWHDWASGTTGPLGVSGWLSTIWAGSSHT
jgi:hypothetical protein